MDAGGVLARVTLRLGSVGEGQRLQEHLSLKASLPLGGPSCPGQPLCTPRPSPRTSARRGVIWGRAGERRVSRVPPRKKV